MMKGAATFEGLDFGSGGLTCNADCPLDYGACSVLFGASNIDATFDDEGSSLICGDFPAIAGSVIPDQPLSVFDGDTAQGTWTLEIADLVASDTGTLAQWCVTITF